MPSRTAARAARASHARFAAGWSVVVLALLAAPLAVALLVRPAGTTYTWVFVNPSDAFIYLTQMGQASRGHWDFVNVYSAQHLPGQPTHLFYSLLGHLVPAPLVGPTGFGLAYQGSRLVLAALLLWQLWLFLGEVCPSGASRRLGFLLAVGTAGFGVYELAIPSVRASRQIFDLVFDESSTFAGMMAVPHHVLFLLLLVIFLRAMIRVVGRPGHNWPSALVAAGAAASLAVIHPDKAMVTTVTVAVAVAWTWRLGRSRPGLLAEAALIALAPVPYVAGLAALVLANPALSTLDRAGNAVNPNPLFYILGFGLTGLVVIAAAPVTRARASRVPPGQLVGWSMVVGSVLNAATPLRVVDHQFEGLQLVLAALAATALVHRFLPRLWRRAGFRRLAARRLLGYDRRQLRALTINLFVLAGAATVLAYWVSLAAGPSLQPRDIYVQPGDVAAAAWLRQNAAPDGVVLATPTSARFVTAYGQARVVVGDFSFTPNGGPEVRELTRFFTTSRYDRAAYLAQRRVRFLYFGSTERAVAAFDPSRLSYLSAVYDAQGVTIYEVRL